MNTVGTSAHRFQDDIKTRINDIEIVAGSAIEAVIAEAAIEGVVTPQAPQLVVAGIAGNHVGKAVPRACNGSVGEDQVIQVDTEGVIQWAAHRVDATAKSLGDYI